MGFIVKILNKNQEIKKKMPILLMIIKLSNQNFIISLFTNLIGWMCWQNKKAKFQFTTKSVCQENKS